MSRNYLLGDTTVAQALKAIGIDDAHRFFHYGLPLPDWATQDKPTPMREQARARLQIRAAEGDKRAKALLAFDVEEILPGGWRKGKGQG